MRTINAKQGQNLFNIALQELGSVLGVITIALMNGMSITDPLTPGQELLVPETPLNASVVDYYRTNNISPATALETSGGEQLLFNTGLFETGLFE
jgi:hypothetical protein